MGPRNRFWLTGFMGLFICVGTSILSAQPETTRPPIGETKDSPPVFKILGRVEPENSQVVPEILQVRLEKNSAMVDHSFVRSDRSFEFNNLPAGTYTVVIRHPQYEDVDLSVEADGRISRTLFVLVSLIPKRQEGSNAQKFRADDDLSDTVSAALLSQKIPPKAQKFYRKSLEFQSKKKYPEAIRQLREALALAPDFYSAQRNLGILYFLSEQPADAVSPLKAALKINPGSAKVNYFLGLAAFRLGDLTLANGYFSAAIALSPDKAAPYYFQGYIAYKQGRLDDAEKSLKKAMEVDNWVGSFSRLQLANVYIKRSDLVEAYRQMESFLKEQPTAQEVSQVMSNLRALRELLSPPPNHP